MDSGEENLNTFDGMDDSTDLILHREKKDYEYTGELELVRFARENFLTWKDYDY
ncbi:MAG: hypothetical protein P0S93_01230 [Candidatus Neptunochlamydia sp.]|nr:hypothetical protein [Candidatus Neptunochlamydia sp.]